MVRFSFDVGRLARDRAMPCCGSGGCGWDALTAGYPPFLHSGRSLYWQVLFELIRSSLTLPDCHRNVWLSANRKSINRALVRARISQVPRVRWILECSHSISGKTYLVAVENHCTCYVHFENAAVSRDRDRLSRARSSAIKRYFSHEMHVGPALAVIISFHMRVGGGGG